MYIKINETLIPCDQPIMARRINERQVIKIPNIQSTYEDISSLFVDNTPWKIYDDEHDMLYDKSRWAFAGNIVYKENGLFDVLMIERLEEDDLTDLIDSLLLESLGGVE